MLFQIKRYRIEEFSQEFERRGITFDIDMDSLDRGSVDVMIDASEKLEEEIKSRLEEWQS